MRTQSFRCVIVFALLALSSVAGAQQLKIESRGQAEEDAQKEAVTAAAMSKAVGMPMAGHAQVVFFRSSKSPGEAIDVVADGSSAGEVPAGMYLAMAATPGTHDFGPGALSLKLSAGETRYVQVIRNRAGQPQVLRSTASNFQKVARQAK